MRDGRRLWRAVVSASAALSTCAALAFAGPPAAAAAPARPTNDPARVTAAPATGTATAHPANTAPHRPAAPKRDPGRPIHGDIVPGHAPAGGIQQHAAGKTKVTKVLVVLGYWDKHDSTTSAEAKKLVITEADDWYRRASYGHQGLSGTATKWLKIPKQKCGVLNDNVINAAKKAADKAHYHPSRYDRIVLYEPCHDPDAIGIGNLPGDQVVLMKGGMNLPTAVHEQGHNYGLGHANQLLCTEHGSRATYQPGASCKTREYEDFSSAMSSKWSDKYAPDFTAPQKNELGWLSGHVKTVSGAGSVTLDPYESTSGTHAIKIPGSSGRTYWVEYRTTRGNDAHLPKAYRGVLIHMSKPGGGAARLNQSLLLHTLAPDPNVPGFAADADPAYLPPTSSWTTPDGIRITVTSESSGSAKITVARPVTAQKPGTVQDKDATALDASAMVTFQRAPDGGLPIRSYTVTAHTGGHSGPSTTVTDFSDHTTLHATVSGLTNGADYTFSIKATNEAGSGTSVDTAQVTPLLRPPTAVIDSPAGGDVHDVVAVRAHGVPNAVTNAKITELELLVDNIPVGDVAASSHTFRWDTGDAPGFAQDADHMIKVIATDANGRNSSDIVIVNLTHSTGPNLSLTDFTGAGGGVVDINGTLHPNGAGSTHELDALTVRIGDNEDDFNSPDEGPFTDPWDTHSLPAGNQTIKITARDQAGRVSVISTTVPLDNPVVTLDDPASGDAFGNVDFTGMVTNNSPVDDVTVELDRGSTVVAGPQTIHVASGGTAPFTLTENMDTEPAGPQVYTVEAVDQTARSAPTTALNLNVVRKKPDVTVTGPTGVVHDTVHFTGTATNNSGTDGLSIVIKKGTTTLAGPTTLTIAAGATGDFDVPVDLGAQSDATTSFTVTVTDNKTSPGSTSVPRSLVVSHLPGISLTDPAGTTTVFGAAQFSGTVTNHSATAGLTVAVSTESGTVSPASQNVTVLGRHSAGFDFVEDVDDVDAGSDVIFTLTVTDADGLVTTLDREVAVTHPAPDLTPTAPAPPGAVVSGITHFTGTVTNNSGTDGLSLTIEVDDSAFITSDLDVAAGATLPYDVSGDVGTFSVGSHAFVTTVTDANSRSAEDSRQLEVDHPPAVTIGAPTNGNVSGMVTVTGTVTNGAPAAGILTVTASVDPTHTNTDTPTVAQGATGNYSIVLDLSGLTGNKTITVSATDASGVTTTTPVTVQVTVVALAGVAVTTPADDDVITTGSVHFTGTVTNHAATTQAMTVHVTDGDTIDETVPVPAAAAGVATNWSDDIDVSALDHGPVTFTVTASYSFGGTSTPVTVTVDVENP